MNDRLSDSGLRALAKFRGSLVIVECGPPAGDTGACPLCGCRIFFDDSGWDTCYDCLDYSVLASDRERIENEIRKGRSNDDASRKDGADEEGAPIVDQDAKEDQEGMEEADDPQHREDVS
jgi:hypothetical protein